MWYALKNNFGTSFDIKESVKPKIIVLLLTCIAYTSIAQEYINTTQGLNARAGLTFNFGSHIQRVGLYATVYYETDNMAFTIHWEHKYSLKSLGPSLSGYEMLLSAGVDFGLNKSETDFGSEIYAPTLTNYEYKVGYHYNWYVNTMGTQQPTGSIGLRFKHIEFVHENDILGKPRSDKYRTAALALIYHNNDQVYGIASSLWTGDKDDENAKPVNDSSFARYGYIDLSNARFGDSSHGVLNAFMKRDLGYGNVVGGAMGIDHEKVRNAIQNKFFHDMWFFPEQWNKAQHRHIPMVDREGRAYIYSEKQQIKKGSLYFDVNLNGGLFY